DEQARSPAQDVWPQHGLDGVEHLGVENQVVKAGELEMPLVADHVAGGQSAAALEPFYFRAYVCGFGRRKRGDRKHVAVPAILFDLRCVEYVVQCRLLPNFAYCLM